MTQTIKRYLISSAVSFLTGFALIMGTEIDNITLEAVKNGAWIGTLFLAVRAGLKAIFEMLVVSLTHK